MVKIKVLKKLPKQKKQKIKFNTVNKPLETSKFKDDYFKFYDDIKHPTHQHYDW